MVPSVSAAGTAILLATGTLLCLGLVTLVALEGREVVTLVTTDRAGVSRETRTWVADDGDGVLIEAAHPERPFFRHVLENPALEMRRGGHAFRCQAAPLPNPEGHARVRRLLSAKYGW